MAREALTVRGLSMGNVSDDAGVVARKKLRLARETVQFFRSPVGHDRRAVGATTSPLYRSFAR